MILHRMVPSGKTNKTRGASYRNIGPDEPFHPSPPKQHVLAPLQDAEGAAGCRRPRPELASWPHVSLGRRARRLRGHRAPPTRRKSPPCPKIEKMSTFCLFSRAYWRCSQRWKQGPIGRPEGLGAPISGQLPEGRPETAGRGRSPTLS